MKKKEKKKKGTNYQVLLALVLRFCHKATVHCTQCTKLTICYYIQNCQSFCSLQKKILLMQITCFFTPHNHKTMLYQHCKVVHLVPFCAKQTTSKKVIKQDTYIHIRLRTLGHIQQHMSHRSFFPQNMNRQSTVLNNLGGKYIDNNI